MVIPLQVKDVASSVPDPLSLPPEDLHVRFVMRTALWVNEKKCAAPRLKVHVVNPDRNMFLRFARLIKTPIQYSEAPFERVSLEELIEKS